MNDTIVYSTVCIERDPMPVDFTPLRVDYFAVYTNIIIVIFIVVVIVVIIIVVIIITVVYFFFICYFCY